MCAHSLGVAAHNGPAERACRAQAPRSSPTVCFTIGSIFRRALAGENPAIRPTRSAVTRVAISSGEQNVAQA